MENGNWTFTTINHTARKRLSLSMNEYAYLDYIYKTQTHPDYSDNGWCNTGQEKIAEFLGLSKGAVVRISQRMVEKKLLNKTPGGRKKVTTKWYKTAYETGGSKSDP